MCTGWDMKNHTLGKMVTAWEGISAEPAEDCCLASPKAGCWDSTYTPERCCAEPPEGSVGALGVLDEDFTEAYIKATGDAADGLLGCPEEPLGLWRTVRMAAAALNTSRRYGMPGQQLPAEDTSLILGHVRSWLGDRRAWEAAASACPAGAGRALELVVAQVDRELGEEEAKAAWRLRAELDPGCRSFGQLAVPGGRR
ncbi:unnamed protein product [Prorocentrum cordatum]|uniref:Uncharacterized protein n=1 Tax=Prorocentrum cordatum TaxID=2364126 RepID=A0ABN9XRK4_9DINO|nr:unnamed protein product [Polarella glacialis]